ncbi:MAG TPA: alpha-galactosidase [Acidobacteriaceae bacterium]|jgi:alpha-galactosidase|nr:alpha-galactosidase [Acidobacteriaceae bacterium]
MRIRALTAVVLWLSALGAFCQSWTIGNDRIERVVSFDPVSGLVTQRLADLTTHTEFVSPGKSPRTPTLEFSFACNGQTLTGATFQLLKADESTLPDGKSLTIHLQSKAFPLEVSVVYRVYDGHPAIRKWLVLKNTGSTPLHLSHLNIEAIAPSVGLSNETVLNAQYGAIPRETFYTGRSEDAGLFVSNARTGDGFAIVSEVPGYMKRTEINAWYDPGRVHIGVLYDTDLMPFERTLAPGSEFKTAAVSLLTFRNGDGFSDPHWVLPSYTSSVLRRKIVARGTPWIYNTWEPFERKINRETTLQLIDVAAVMGMDIFTIDDGWQQEYGENTVDTTAFPGGLDPIREAVEAKGMRLGLWIPLAAIGLKTADYVKHPNWAALDESGKPKLTRTMAGSKVVMCLASPFQDAAAERINDAIERFHLAYVKLDLTTIFNAYGEAPGCWAKGHYHGNWAESLNMIYEGISHVTSKVYEKHPDVLLDLTFELWGQKHVIDAGLLAAGDLDWMSNVSDGTPDAAGTLQARTLLYQRAPSMPVESMLIGNLHADLPSPQETFATAIGSAPLLLGDLRKLSTADQQWYHDHIQWFKQLRKSTDLNQSFFPLGDWRQPSSATWDGFARLSRTGDGVIAIFRNKSDTSMVNLQLPLIPNGRFKVHSVVTNKELGTFTKDDWMRGVPVQFAGSQAVEILEVKKE